MKLFFSFLVLLIAQTLPAQLSRQYIDSVSSNYSSNLIENFKISPDGKTYVYKYNQQLIKLHTPDQIIDITARFIFYMDNKMLLYSNNNKLFKKNLLKPLESDQELGDFIGINLIFSKKILHLKNKNLLLFTDNYYEEYQNIENFRTKGDLEQYVVLTNTKGENIYLFQQQQHVFSDSILTVIEGKTENLIVTATQIHKINNTTGKVTTLHHRFNNTDQQMFSQPGIQYTHSNNKIYSKEVKDTGTVQDFYLSAPQLDLNYFHEISSNLKASHITTIRFTDILSGDTGTVFSFLSRRAKNEFNLYRDLFIYDANIEVNNELMTVDNLPVIRSTVYNIPYEQSIQIDSLVPSCNTFVITPDARFLYIADRQQSLYRYDFQQRSLMLLMQSFPFKPYNIQVNDSRDYLQLAHYDEQEQKAYFNTNGDPLMIDAAGKIEFITTRLAKGSFQNTVLYKVVDKNQYLVYSLNEETGISSLNYIHGNKNRVLTANDSYKIPQAALYLPNKDYEKGYFFIKGRFIVWSESNLATGTRIYTYDLTTESVKHLPVVFEKQYDSLKYEYFSYHTGKELIRGGLKYPKNFDMAKKYPVIISLYLNKLHHLHFPSMGNYAGELQNIARSALLNELNLLHQGYIIAYIDIPFENGIYSSHSYYANEIIRKVFSKNQHIDLASIGLLGHSRTAGQALGVLTTDTLVKTAVISNGVLSELLDASQFSDYSFTNSPYSPERSSRFFRKLGYSMNSSYNQLEDLKNDYSYIQTKDPFLQLNRLNSTVLFLLNDADGSISSNNGYFTYIKTKLLNKNTYLLNFHKEGHNLLKPENAAQAYRILMSYLNFYLKEKNDKNKPWAFRQP
ncbi:alpha/beta hydrolase family protein [Gynurincola endophyticus]|uniref:alpha/beta hydrolase family protein n=1 Tax=Gynurincola endophyticus TaxID=2479004 RepID=UPI000F8E0EC4|nr:hypothetical protein [Gynurincola endophyticus]